MRHSYLTLIVLSIFVSQASARDLWSGQIGGLSSKQQTIDTAYCRAYYRINRIGAALDNFGAIAFRGGGVDCFGKAYSYAGMEFPAGSHQTLLYWSGLWIGAMKGGTPLVSSYLTFEGDYLTLELAPDELPFGGIGYRSTLDPTLPSFEGAVSEQDFLCSFTDTVPDPPFYGPPGDFLRGPGFHPLDIAVTMNSYGWSFGYAQDFILFDVTVKNIGASILHQAFVGLHANEAVGYASSSDSAPPFSLDDVVGIRKVQPLEKCGASCDTLNIAWWSDNDGDPADGGFISTGAIRSCRAAGGLMFLNPIETDERFGFNWWRENYDPALDWGPRHRGTEEIPFHDFHTGGLGTPMGDANKLYVMSSGEIDFDVPEISSIDYFDPVWVGPSPAIKSDLMDGGAFDFVLSRGPFEVAPGEEYHFAFALLAAETFHTDPYNGENLRLGKVDAYYSHLDFSDLVTNAKWAKWIYDNPGVDTDGDGYFGKSRICVIDSSLVDGE